VAKFSDANVDGYTDVATWGQRATGYPTNRSGHRQYPTRRTLPNEYTGWTNKVSSCSSETVYSLTFVLFIDSPCAGSGISNLIISFKNFKLSVEGTKTIRFISFIGRNVVAPESVLLTTFLSCTPEDEGANLASCWNIFFHNFKNNKCISNHLIELNNKYTISWISLWFV